MDAILTNLGVEIELSPCGGLRLSGQSERMSRRNTRRNRAEDLRGIATKLIGPWLEAALWTGGNRGDPAGDCDIVFVDCGTIPGGRGNRAEPLRGIAT